MIREHCIENGQGHNNIDDNPGNHFHLIKRNQLIDIIDKLKDDKKEDSGLFTNHIKFATDKFHTLLSMFFNAMLRHGAAPEDLLLGTMFPLIKNSRGNAQNSDNYRAITI